MANPKIPPAYIWPRLQSSQERPHWLKLDFEHWEDLSDEEGEEGAEGAEEEKSAQKLLTEREEKRVH